MVFSATWLVWGTVALIMTLFWGGYFIARAAGQFDGLEEVKYTILKETPGHEDR
ncbi:MAG: hypothetical protein ACE5G8_03500 [Anaerolineae bacterium]